MILEKLLMKLLVVFLILSRKSDLGIFRWSIAYGDVITYESDLDYKAVVEKQLSNQNKAFVGKIITDM